VLREVEKQTERSTSLARAVDLRQFPQITSSLIRYEVALNGNPDSLRPMRLALTTPTLLPPCTRVLQVKKFDWILEILILACGMWQAFG
jgi:hypothetical protein